jgi:hypothetical protein
MWFDHRFSASAFIEAPRRVELSVRHVRCVFLKSTSQMKCRAKLGKNLQSLEKSGQRDIGFFMSVSVDLRTFTGQDRAFHRLTPMGFGVPWRGITQSRWFVSLMVS